MYDEWNRQRFSNTLKDGVKGLPNVAWRDEYDVAKAKYMNHIKYALYPPKKGVKPLMDDIARTGWRPQYEVVSAPEHVFAQFKADGDAVASIHLLNYRFLKPVSNIRIRLPKGKVPVFNAPFEQAPIKGSVREVEPGVWELPAFARYAYCVIK